MSDKIDVVNEAVDKAFKAKVESEAHAMMLKMLENLAPESRRPIYSLPVKTQSVTTKVGDIMMLALTVDDDVGYAVKACEFLDRVEEACVAFIEQSKTEGEQNGSN